ncbi:MAG: hypothetical protein H6741_10595 [Alphaproteobacteria bacterium]|nr:hypothetical protein [Alphaproteobacteria bacterium]
MRFLSSLVLPTPSVRNVRFNTEGFQDLDSSWLHQTRGWQTAEHDELLLQRLPERPRLYTPESLPELTQALQCHTAATGRQLVELSQRSLGPLCVTRVIVKEPQAPVGTTYLGALSFPLGRRVFSVALRCPERGTAGLREMRLQYMRLRAGEVPMLNPDGTIGFVDWDPDHPDHDALLPDHPLSRLRRQLHHIEQTLEVDWWALPLSTLIRAHKAVHQPRFGLPEAS